MFYISSGALTAMYTLRERYDEKIVISGEPQTVTRDHHIRNLSTDAKKARTRAAELGYKVAPPSFTLQDIKRRNAEQMAAARLLEEERAEGEALKQKQKHDGQLRMIRDGLFPFGRNEGVKLEKLAASKSEGWVAYWVKTGRATENDPIIQAIGKWYEVAHPEIVKTLDFTFTPGHFGTPGARVKKVKITLIKSASFEGYYGTQYVDTFASECGKRLVYIGGAGVSCANGETITASFTIKEHTEYQGEDQTKIQRIKLFDDVAG